MAIPTGYSVRRGIALVGMLADTSAYNVDGACAASGRIEAGTAVKVTSVEPIDGHKVVAAVGAVSDIPYGVVLRSHAYTPDGYAADAEAVNVVSAGRIWMRSAGQAAPGAFGTQVKLTTAGFCSSTGTIMSGWTYAGGFVAGGYVDPVGSSTGDSIVEVQLTQSAPIPASAT